MQTGLWPDGKRSLVNNRNDFWDDIAPQVDPYLCRRCADCAPVAVCLAKGVRRDDPEGVPYVDTSICFGCYSCAGACPHGAIILPREG
jgi:Fe-S-cluster-containing dehydrogenase component